MPLRVYLALSVCLSAQNLSVGPEALSCLLLGGTQRSPALPTPSHSKSQGSLASPCPAPPPPLLALKDKGTSTLSLALALPRTRASGSLLIKTQANSLELVDTLEGEGPGGGSTTQLEVDESSFLLSSVTSRLRSPPFLLNLSFLSCQMRRWHS